MLKIIGENSCEQINIELGDYVPFKFQYFDSNGMPHLFWRSGDLKSTLLEIEISRNNGQIVGGALVLPGVVSKVFPTLKIPTQSSVGAPIVCVDNWSDDRYADDPMQFQVFADPSRLLIMFSSPEIAERVIVAGNLVFGVSSNNFLLWILATDLDYEE